MAVTKTDSLPKITRSMTLDPFSHAKSLAQELAQCEHYLGNSEEPGVPHLKQALAAEIGKGIDVATMSGKLRRPIMIEDQAFLVESIVALVTSWVIDSNSKHLPKKVRTLSQPPRRY